MVGRARDGGLSSGQRVYKLWVELAPGLVEELATRYAEFIGFSLAQP